MSNDMFFVQCITVDTCEHLNVDILYFGNNYDKALNILRKNIDIQTDKLFEDCTIDEIENTNFVNETKEYWDYCDDDGKEVVIMLEKLTQN